MLDPIADMLTRIRNALAARHEVAEVSHSALKVEIARILKKEGFITDYVVEGGGAKKTLRVYLKYTDANEPAIRVLKRVSRSGLRKYSRADRLPKPLGGLGLAIMTTSSGVMTSEDARKQNIGGEVLCEVW
jgi:small subunit ribosomal protein S8